MTSNSWPLANSTKSRSTAEPVLSDYRARQLVAEHERAQQRQLELAEQHSLANPPAVRIRAWEKVHGLALPLDSGHPILEVIAVGTRLTLAEVQAEQRARLAQPSAGTHQTLSR